MGKYIKKTISLKDATLEGEIWKEVNEEGIEGNYLVSNFGRIYSKICQRVLITHKARTGGYICVAITCGKVRKTFRLHRLIAKSFIPNPFNKKEVNHIDKDVTNNRVENLEWFSPKENQMHKMGVSVWHKNQTRITSSDYSVARRKLEGFSDKIIPMLKQIVPLE